MRRDSIGTSVHRGPRPRSSLGVALAVALVSGSVPADLSGQGRREALRGLTADDYARAEQLLSWNAATLTTGTGPIYASWLQGDLFWFVDTTRDGRTFFLVDPGARTKRPAFDHGLVASALSVAADTSYVATDLPFTWFWYVENGTAIAFYIGARYWTCGITAWGCTSQEYPAARPGESLSPDGRFAAFTKDYNLWIRSTRTGDSTQLTTDGVAHYAYASHPEECCSAVTDQRSGPRPPVLAWSPDGSKIATHRYDERNVGQLHLLETVIGRPILHSYRYALPGDSILPRYDLYVFDVNTSAGVKVDTEPMVGGAGSWIPGAWDVVRWGPTGEQLFFTRHDPGFDEYRLAVADASTGSVRTVVVERQSTFVDLNQIPFYPPMWRVINGGAEVIWYSERDGWGHLYLYDVQTGTLKNRITRGQWAVLDVSYVNEAERTVYFGALGREPDSDPYLGRFYRAPLDGDGSGVRLLTPEPSDHLVQVSPSGRLFLDIYSRRDTVPVTVVRDMADGRVLQQVREADVTRLVEAGWQWPVRFSVKARDGITDLWGYLHLPPDFDPGRQYPVIDNIYPGPQIGAIWNQSFSVLSWGEVQALAHLGFIVVSFDALGTPQRSKAFHDYDYGRISDNGLPDHVVAIRQLGARYPQMDLDRVGIIGHSGGGMAAARAMLEYPKFFKVGVSGAGNHDNRSYIFAWGNKYQGLLVRDSLTGGDNYAAEANQNLAANLEGKLLLTFGTMDDNVHPNNTMLLIDSLVAHDKDFDVVVMPNRNHDYMSEPYALRRGWDYFVRHLLGVEPPREYTIRPPPGP